MIADIDSLIPIGTRLLIKIEKVKDMSDGGIKLPQEFLEREQDKISDGILIKKGPTAFDGFTRHESDSIPEGGNKVYFVKYAGKALRINNEEYRMINDEDVYAFERC